MVGKKLKAKYEPDDNLKEQQRQYYERNYPKPDDVKTETSKADPRNLRKKIKLRPLLYVVLFYVYCMRSICGK